jgi:integrase
MRACTRGHGADKVRWGFAVDVAPVGAPRQQIKRTGFETKEAATAAKAKLLDEHRRGVWVQPDRMTVRDYLEQWITRLEATKRETGSTLYGWRVCIEHHLVPHLGDIRIQQLTQPQIRACYHALDLHGNTRTGGPLAPKSVWNVHLCLSRALQDAVADGLIAGNPAHKARSQPKRRARVDFWTSVELAQFLAWADRERSFQDRALWRMAAQTGMRRGELLGLRWSDIHGSQALVSRAHAKLGHEEFSDPKTEAGVRTIDLSDDTLAALRSWQAEQTAQAAGWQEAYQRNDLVFCREDGTPHDPDVTSDRFRTAVLASGVKRIRLHDLRHTSAVIGLRELGEWPDEVSARLGHSSVAFTLETYGHLIPARGRAVAAGFDQLLRARTAPPLAVVTEVSE